MNRPLLSLSLLSLIVIIGLAGMLVGNGWIDRLMFLLAALPLLIGTWRWWVYREQA